MTSMTPAELANEQTITSLRAELCELRALFTAQTEKLGMASALCGFEADVPLATMRFQIGARLSAVPEASQRNLEVVARHLEAFYMETSTGVGDVTPDSWTQFRAPAQQMLRALNSPVRA